MNEAFLRNLVGVVLTIAAITARGLWYGTTRPPMPKHSFAPETPAAKTPEALGASLFERKGCAGCHSVDGSSRVGPSLHRDFGSMVALADGSTVEMNETYIRESLHTPRAKARPGFPDVMPSFDGVLSERETAALVAYIASLR
jgi:cytochrome c553